MPKRIGEREFRGQTVLKVASGANHTVVLTNTKVFAWGDSDFGKVGRNLRSRHKIE